MSKWKKVALWKKILIGVVIGLIIGLVSPKAAEVISPLGDIFLRMLKMLIVPLVFFSITSGVCKMGDVKQLRTVGIRYVLWIIASAVIAAICGVIGGLIVQPGRGTTEFLATAEAAEAQSYSFIDNVISWFPTNIVESMANANMLQIIVFCLFLGVALLALGDKAKTVIRFIDEGSEVMLKITEYVIEFSPFGILSLIATMVSTISGAMMKEVLVFLITDNVICLLILILVYPLIIKLLAKLPPFGFMRKIAPAILVAVSTSSSAATLPVSIKISEEDLGHSREHLRLHPASGQHGRYDRLRGVHRPVLCLCIESLRLPRYVFERAPVRLLRPDPVHRRSWRQGRGRRDVRRAAGGTWYAADSDPHSCGDLACDRPGAHDAQ